MSYCRFSNGECGPLDEPSDVYMYPGIDIFCVGCNLHFQLRSKALKHLKDHIANGDRVPQWAINRLKEEIRDYGDDVDNCKPIQGGQ